MMIGIIKINRIQFKGDFRGRLTALAYSVHPKKNIVVKRTIN